MTKVIIAVLFVLSLSGCSTTGLRYEANKMKGITMSERSKHIEME